MPPTARRLALRGRRALARFVPRLREWEYLPEGWAPERARGWDAPGVVAAYRARLPALRRAVVGREPLALPTSVAGRHPEPDAREQGSTLAFAYALALASRGAERVSVLDWGGGLGFYSLLARAFVPPGLELDYHCKEVPLLCAAGREELPEVHWHEDESCLDRTYDLVLASSSLQYAEHWPAVLERLAGATGGLLLVARIPVTLGGPSFATLQRGPLRTEYLSWVIERDELLATAERAGVELVRELLVGYRPLVHRAPSPVDTRSFLFRALAPRSGIE